MSPDTITDIAAFLAGAIVRRAAIDRATIVACQINRSLVSCSTQRASTAHHLHHSHTPFGITNFHAFAADATYFRLDARCIDAAARPASFAPSPIEAEALPAAPANHSGTEAVFWLNHRRAQQPYAPDHKPRRNRAKPTPRY
jgi:hypothetical protein